jgi:transcriptional repressor NrdR
VRCPHCAEDDDKVVDTRPTDDGTAIRRRRECLGCGRRYTTFERVDEAPLVVVKADGRREPFDRTKIAGGVTAACKGRPVTPEQIGELAAQLEERFRVVGGDVPSAAVGHAVLERLRDLDQVAYVRFASVYKDFSHPTDFEREVGLLTQTPPS